MAPLECSPPAPALLGREAVSQCGNPNLDLFISTGIESHGLVSVSWHPTTANGVRAGQTHDAMGPTVISGLLV